MFYVCACVCVSERVKERKICKCLKNLLTFSTFFYISSLRLNLDTLKMDTPVVKLAQQLINIESISGKEQPMATFLQDYLTEAGWVVDLQEVAAPLEGDPGMVLNYLCIGLLFTLWSYWSYISIYL